MTALTQTEYAYCAYCADCNEGFGPEDDEELVDSWAAEHNEEHHS